MRKYIKTLFYLSRLICHWACSDHGLVSDNHAPEKDLETFNLSTSPHNKICSLLFSSRRKKRLIISTDLGEYEDLMDRLSQTLNCTFFELP